jgi:hypothetical protein
MGEIKRLFGQVPRTIESFVAKADHFVGHERLINRETEKEKIECKKVCGDIKLLAEDLLRPFEKIRANQDENNVIRFDKGFVEHPDGYSHVELASGVNFEDPFTTTAICVSLPNSHRKELVLRNGIGLISYFDKRMGWSMWSSVTLQEARQFLKVVTQLNEQRIAFRNFTR